MINPDWLDSLERAVQICRDQVGMAEAFGAQTIAVPVDRLAKLLDAIQPICPHCGSEDITSFCETCGSESFSEHVCSVTSH